MSFFNLFLIAAQLLAAQPTGPSGITMSGKVVSKAGVHHLRLVPVGGPLDKALDCPVAIDATFECKGLEMTRYRLAIQPPLEPGAEVPQLEIHGLAGAEVLVYDPDHPDEKLVVNPGVTTLLKVVPVVAALYNFAKAGGTEVIPHAYRSLILEFRTATQTGQPQTPDAIGAPR